MLIQSESVKNLKKKKVIWTHKNLCTDKPSVDSRRYSSPIRMRK